MMNRWPAVLSTPSRGDNISSFRVSQLRFDQATCGMFLQIFSFLKFIDSFVRRKDASAVDCDLSEASKWQVIVQWVAG